MRSLTIALVAFSLSLGFLEGTPSTVFWTVCTTDVYATGTGHVDEDNYFSVFNRRGHGSNLPPDVGLELGVFSWSDLSVEAGVDYLGGTDDPLYFNAGLAIAEDKLFCHAPAIKLGYFNAGTRNRGLNRTNQNIVDLIIGKTLPEWLGGGRLCVGGFSGSRAMGKVRQGVMVSFQQPFCSAKDCNDKDYYKWVLCGDWASGKNTIGGGGIGIYYYFTPDISILTGPVWFNTSKYNGAWKWTAQIDISFSAWTRKE